MEAKHGSAKGSPQTPPASGVPHAKATEKGKAAPAGPKSLGPVPNLEEHVHPEWWRQIFNSLYLKTDADVVDDQQHHRPRRWISSPRS